MKKNMNWINWISIILCFIVCGTVVIGLIYGNNPVKKEFNLIEVAIFCLLGPLLILIYTFLYIFVNIFNLINKIKQKLNERKTKI